MENIFDESLMLGYSASMLCQQLNSNTPPAARAYVPKLPRVRQPLTPANMLSDFRNQSSFNMNSEADGRLQTLNNSIFSIDSNASMKKNHLLKNWTVEPAVGCEGVIVKGFIEIDGKERKSCPIGTRIHSHMVVSRSGVAYTLLGSMHGSGMYSGEKALEHEYFGKGFPENWRHLTKIYLDRLRNEALECEACPTPEAKKIKIYSFSKKPAETNDSEKENLISSECENGEKIKLVSLSKENLDKLSQNIKTKNQNAKSENRGFWQVQNFLKSDKTEPDSLKIPTSSLRSRKSSGSRTELKSKTTKKKKNRKKIYENSEENVKNVANIFPTGTDEKKQVKKAANNSKLVLDIISRPPLHNKERKKKPKEQGEKLSEKEIEENLDFILGEEIPEDDLFLETPGHCKQSFFVATNTILDCSKQAPEDEFFSFIIDEKKSNATTIMEISSSEISQGSRRRIKDWAILCCQGQLYVEGCVIKENNKSELFRTGAVVQVSNSGRTIHTISGTRYDLVGNMLMQASLDAGMPIRIARKFATRFPRDWERCWVNLNRSDCGSYQGNNSHAGTKSVPIKKRLRDKLLRLPKDSSDGEDISSSSMLVSVPVTLKTPIIAQRRIEEEIEDVKLSASKKEKKFVSSLTPINEISLNTEHSISGSSATSPSMGAIPDTEPTLPPDHEEKVVKPVRRPLSPRKIHKTRSCSVIPRLMNSISEAGTLHRSDDLEPTLPPEDGVKVVKPVRRPRSPRKKQAVTSLHKMLSPEDKKIVHKTRSVCKAGNVFQPDLKKRNKEVTRQRLEKITRNLKNKSITPHTNDETLTDCNPKMSKRSRKGSKVKRERRKSDAVKALYSPTDEDIGNKRDKDPVPRTHLVARNYKVPVTPLAICLFKENGLNKFATSDGNKTKKKTDKKEKGAKKDMIGAKRKQGQKRERESEEVAPPTKKTKTVESGVEVDIKKLLNDSKAPKTAGEVRRRTAPKKREEKKKTEKQKNKKSTMKKTIDPEPQEEKELKLVKIKWTSYKKKKLSSLVNKKISWEEIGTAMKCSQEECEEVYKNLFKMKEKKKPAKKLIYEDQDDVEAKRGTLKHRRQVRQKLEVLKNPKPQFQDLFSSGNLFSMEGSSHFAVDLFAAHDPTNDVLPMTPNTKPPVGMDDMVATPAWFKTPSGTSNPSEDTGWTSYINAKTPVAMKEIFSPKHEDIDQDQRRKEADRVIVQMKKKMMKGTLREFNIEDKGREYKKTPKKKSRKLDINFDLLKEAKKNQDEEELDTDEEKDEYFDDCE